MITYLKATDKEQLHSLMEQAGLLVEREAFGIVEKVPTVEFVEIGLIQNPTGERVESGGMLIDVFEPVEGYHANIHGVLTSEQAEILSPITIEAPQTPRHNWA